MIRKQGTLYELRAKRTGKLLGRHKSRAQAEAQERAINAAKHSRRGKKK